MDDGSLAPPACPIATYRLQFGSHFTFEDAAALVPYLKALGISHVYASPYLRARPGSAHGYDIIDHNTFNPEIGDDASFNRFAQALADNGMGQILDFVPNHMGVIRGDNPWWNDMLEWGRHSPHAEYFDVDWESIKPELQGKILVAVLGDHYGSVLERGELRLNFQPETGRFTLDYWENSFPLRPDHYALLLRASLAGYRDREGADPMVVSVLEGLVSRFAAIEPPTSRQQAMEVRERGLELMAELAGLVSQNPMVAHLATAAARVLDGTPGNGESWRHLHDVLEAQHYRLSFWRVASHEINYRRFFDVNDLAGVRMESPRLFVAAHGLVGRLIAEGKVHGLRIDHIDGLFDPEEYCRRLQDLAARARPGAPPLYVVVEKILARHEHLREDWAISGATGYKALNLLNGIFIDPDGEQPLTRIYHRFIGADIDFEALTCQCKKLVINTLMTSELTMLASELDRLSEQDWHTRDFTLESLRQALEEVVACFPVYRTYVTPEAITAEDRRDIDWAVSQAKRRWQGPDSEILSFVHAVLTGDLGRDETRAHRRADVQRFVGKFQQYTGPVMAKALEDTAFYRYHRLISLNEVGGDPRLFGVSLASFHRANRERAQRWPASLVATATHDTKRGEDARTRLDVLSEVPQEWMRRVRRWATLNRFRRTDIDDRPAPSRNDEYLIYQTLLGAWPAGKEPVGVGTGGTARLVSGEFVARIKAYLIKALREGKERSTWHAPNEVYEAACLSFVDSILDETRAIAFLKDFVPFQARIARYGMLNSLVQTVFKLTLPGVPDIYQGGELWDLDLVDPDNRRPVDFDHRRRLLDTVDAVRSLNTGRAAAVQAMLDAWPDGRIKLYLLSRCLGLRQTDPDLFAAGDYDPLTVTGTRADHVCAFARRRSGRAIVVVAARFLARLDDRRMTTDDRWADTAVDLAPCGRGRFVDVFTGAEVVARRDAEGQAQALALGDILGLLPVAVLRPVEA